VTLHLPGAAAPPVVVPVILPPAVPDVLIHLGLSEDA
jgi:hypothetical protein